MSERFELLEIAGDISGMPEEARGDPMAIKGAIEGVISDLAFELEQEQARSKGSKSRL
jgi:hypothetical protein